MRFVVKPFTVPNRRDTKEVRASAKPRPEPVFKLDADSDREARIAIRERYTKLNRTVRSINYVDPNDQSKLVVYVEAR